MTKRQGFSLLELSISLLVIGLLMTAVIKGSDLIAQARLSVARELTAKSPVLEINGLKVWYETTMPNSFIASEIKNGNAISTWYDSSGNTPLNPMTLTQGTSGYRPLYMATGMNNLPALKFDGVDDYLSNTILNFPYNDYSIFMVFNTLDSSTFIDLMSIKNTSSGWGLLIETQASNIFRTLHRFPYSTTSINNDDFSSSTGQFSTNKKYVLSYIRNSTSSPTDSTVRLNGSSIITNTPIRAGFDGSDLYFCVSSLSGTGRYFNGYISEIIIYSRTLSTQERQDIESYLGQKWGVAVL